MKIAVTGKGGVGKTTLSAILSHIYAKEGRSVVAVDADPDANLAQAFGLPRKEIEGIRPIAELTDVIADRTGARPGNMGGMFKLNPRVADIPEEFGYRINGITLLVMGKSKEAASGCYCPENVFLRSLLRHLVLDREEVVIVDMEAGIEHLTRGTAEGVDMFLIVVEPGQRSIQTARTVRDMVAGLGIKRVYAVANKVRNERDEEFVRSALGDIHLLGVIKFNQEIMEADLSGVPPFEKSPETVREVEDLKGAIDKLGIGNVKR
ncbi:CO dehydrogenase accessory protein CooC (nickel insertion) [hydrothermal vent metagenome]|uniref:CO dehydrogenase accessory protein CooC (Nickel insertion) n=1 Tax=hydrothermal vent metagenome TaxID=652676 RepID=A0A3B1CXR6_9ZZZZ